MSHPISHPDVRTSPQRLTGVSSTLLIPLAARAFGDALFPSLALKDAVALPALHRIGEDVGPYLKDKPSVYGVMARTRVFRQLAEQFFERYPEALGASLGCGLSSYFQWLDRDSNQWIDADVSQVMAARRRVLPRPGKRHRQVEVDLTQNGWWKRLGLPARGSGSPVLLICEGVLMYFDPGQVDHFLYEFGQNAPEGSELICDALSWLAVGSASLHPSVGHTSAEFKWGPKGPASFTAAHPRICVKSEHSVMDGYDMATSLVCASFRALWGVPYYGITRLGVRPD
ncbi:MAG: class I SAM-dependent methyltransferase [Pseudomonadota bacterium]